MRTKCNPKNERVKRDYFEWQKEAGRKSEATIYNIRKSLDRFEKHTRLADFKEFGKSTAISFKRELLVMTGAQTGHLLSRSTVRSTLRCLQDFFAWLCQRPGYKRISPTDIEYLNLSLKETNTALSRKIKDTPSIEQISAVVSGMKHETEIEKRNRAVMAFTALTGIRDGALITLRIKHVNVGERLVEQVGDEVHTKFGKTIYTYFFPIGDEIEEIVLNWIGFLKNEKLYGIEDPLFPRTKLGHDSNNCFIGEYLEPVHWQSASQAREIFREAFVNAGMPAYTPHSFRRTLTRLGQEICKTPAHLKAWSQNLGHNDVMTTMVNYGQIDTHTQGKLIYEVANSLGDDLDRPLTKRDLEEIRNSIIR